MTSLGRTLFAVLLLASAPAWAIENLLIFTAAGNGNASSSGDNGTAVAASLARPVDVGVDGLGNWYVLDAGAYVVRKISPSNTITTVAKLPAAARSLAVGKDGTLFVSMATQLRRIAPDGTATSWSLAVAGLALDASGNLYMADPAHAIVRRLTTTGRIATVAGNGGTGSCPDGTVATSLTCLQTPTDVAVDFAGTLYIADSGNSMIWKVVNGRIYATTTQSLFEPSQVSVTKDGWIFFTDNVDGRTSVRWLDENGTYSTVAGTGYAGYSGDGGLAQEAELGGLGGIFVDAARNLYMADPNNHRVRRLRLFATPHAGYDLNDNGLSDLIWRNPKTGQNIAWDAANSSFPRTLSTVTSQDWDIVGGGYFGGSYVNGDLLWRNQRTGSNAIWLSGSAATQQPISAVANTAWKVVGIGEFDGAVGREILWRDVQTGTNALWRAGNSTTQLPIANAGVNWQVGGVGDFDGDGLSDILWHNPSTGANVIWRSGDASKLRSVVAMVAPWQVAAIGDFDNDGRSDIFWRNPSTGANVIWPTGDMRMKRAMSSVSTAWVLASVGDYDGDETDDIIWRSPSTGANAIWYIHRGYTIERWTLTPMSVEWVPAR